LVGKKVDEVDANLIAHSQAVVFDTSRLLRTIGANESSVLVEARYDYLAPSLKVQLDKDRYELAVRDAGGEAESFFVALDELNDATWADARVAAVEAYLARPSVRQFTTVDGRTLSLSDADVRTIVSRARGTFAEFQQSLLRELLSVYPSANWGLEVQALGGYVGGGLIEKAEAQLGKLLPAYVETQLGTGPSFKIGRREVVAPSFAFPNDIRQSAASLLVSAPVEVSDWSAATKTALKGRLEAVLEKSFGVSEVSEIEELVKEGGGRALQLWWNAQRPVIETL